MASIVAILDKQLVSYYWLA